ncbi:MAG: histidine phosphatase family protein [Rhodospirillaceae bacterium]
MSKPPATVTRWWWVRHAPVPSVVGTIYGGNDVPCDVSDRESFRHLASALPKDALWLTSHLSRTHKTAQAIREEGLDFPAPIAEEHLGEQSFGNWQGMTWDEMQAGDPAGFKAFWDDPVRGRPPGGESFADLIDRVSRIIDKYNESHAGQDIVAVTHGGTIRAAMAHSLLLPPEAGMAFTVSTLSVTRLDHIPDKLLRGRGGHWRIVRVNAPPHAVESLVKGGH